MKKSLALPILVFSLFLMSSCQKSENVKSTESNSTKSEVYSEEFEVAGPTITLGIRLYRPKFDCLKGFSLCIGRKKTHTPYNPYDYPVFFMPNETVGDKGVRLSVADLTLDTTQSIMKLVFTMDFDRADGSTIVIDNGYNVFDLDSVALSDLGVNSILMTPGSYNLINIDIPHHKYGTVFIPVTTK